MVFAETRHGHTVRKRSRKITKERIMTDPNFARQRENMVEFENAAQASGFFRNVLSKALIAIGTEDLNNKLTSAMKKVIFGDKINQRGKRTAMAGDSPLLEGFNFSKKELWQVFDTPTPKFFKKVRNTGLALASVAA